VHKNSGINNKAAYLMVDGGLFNGRTINAIGLSKTAKIYYRVQTNLLISGSDYLDLYNALNQACQDLAGSAGITASDCQSVRNATDAVEMNLEPTPGFNPEAAQCPAGQSVSSTLFSDSLEGGNGNWAFARTAGTTNWNVSSGYAASGLYSLYGSDPATVADLTASMVNGITLPANSHLWFRHAFSFEATGGSYYDGGVLEYSTNGGASWTDAGGLFTEGKNYGGTLSTGSNPVGGRSAFVAVSNGYVSSRYDLSALAGQNVRFRWRLGSDSSVGATGWLVDDVKIQACSAGAAAAPGAPTNVVATAGNGTATLAFTPAAANGAPAATFFSAACVAGSSSLTGSAYSSPITVTGLSSNTAYSCSVQAWNSVGASAPSAPVVVVSTSCSYSLSTNSTAVTAGLNYGNVGVTSTSACAWTAISNAGWITVTSGASSNGTSSVVFMVATNTGASARVGTLSIAGQTFTVTQAGAVVLTPPVCTLMASPTSISPGMSSTLTASCTPAATSYLWSNTGFGSAASSGTVAPAATTIYSVAGSNAAGSGSAASAAVIVGTAVASVTDMRTYVPAASAAGGYVSFVRVINNGGVATPVLVARIDGATGAVGASGILTPALPVDGAVTFTAQQVEAALGLTMTGADRPRIRVSGVTSPVEVQSFLLQPGGLFDEVSGFQSGSAIRVRTYIPAADAPSGYTSFVRVINPGASATSVSVALINGTTGVTGPAYTLIGFMPGGGARTFSSAELEAIFGTVAAGSRPRLKIMASTTLEVQSFITQPGGAFTIISGGQ
jgi:hypothetical protein